MHEVETLVILQEMLALIDTGLVYSKDPFDRERYENLKQGAGRLLERVTDLDQSELTALLRPTAAYATPLVDVRAVIMEDDKMLLVKDWSGLWALPGGFCDVGTSPSANVLREVLEETGHKAKLLGFLAVMDSNRWQPQSRQYIKLFYHCQLQAGEFQPNDEVAELGFFSLDSLPPLSEKRTSKPQLDVLMSIITEELRPYSD